MKIDLRTLYALETININKELKIPEEKYKPYDIKHISCLNVKGVIFINSKKILR